MWDKKKKDSNKTPTPGEVQTRDQSPSGWRHEKML